MYVDKLIVKCKVYEAAFATSILYGCESWLGASLAPVERMYMSAIRNILGVRKSTPKLMCLLKAGIPSLAALVQNKQSHFLHKIVAERQGMEESDP